MVSKSTCPNCGSSIVAIDEPEGGLICMKCNHQFPYGEAEEKYKYSLNMVDYGLTQIPNRVFDRPYLKKLDFSAEPFDSFHAPFINRISSIPVKIGLMTDLEELDLSCNVISAIPPEIANCTNLRKLYLGRNYIKKIPKQLCNLRNLESLNLRYNSIKSLPENIGSLTKLKFLNLEGNNLQKLPKSITNLVNLEDFNIKHNSILTSPPYAIALQGIHAITEWFSKSDNE